MKNVKISQLDSDKQSNLVVINYLEKGLNKKNISKWINEKSNRLHTQHPNTSWFFVCLFVLGVGLDISHAVTRIIKLGAIQTDSTIATPAGFSNREKSGQIIFGQFFSYGQSRGAGLSEAREFLLSQSKEEQFIMSASLMIVPAKRIESKARSMDHELHHSKEMRQRCL